MGVFVWGMFTVESFTHFLLWCPHCFSTLFNLSYSYCLLSTLIFPVSVLHLSPSCPCIVFYINLLYSPHCFPLLVTQGLPWIGLTASCSFPHFLILCHHVLFALFSSLLLTQLLISLLLSLCCLSSVLILSCLSLSLPTDVLLSMSSTTSESGGDPTASPDKSLEANASASPRKPRWERERERVF